MELHSKYRHLLRDYSVPSPLLPIVEDMVKSILKEREEYQTNEATREEIDQELADIDAVLEKELTKKSNLDNLAREAALTACKLDDLWAYGTFGNRQKIQNLVFPEGIVWEQTKRENLTKIESEAFV